jgi:Cd2+/Zn2+-exporting ATPase
MCQNLASPGLLVGVYSGSIHMAGKMLVHQLSVLVVILKGMRLLRIPAAERARTAIVPTTEPAAAQGVGTGTGSRASPAR